MGLKTDTVKAWLSHLDSRIGSVAGEFARRIASDAQNALCEQTGEFAGEYSLTGKLREAADGASSSDLSNEEREMFRRLADRIDYLDDSESILHDVEEYFQLHSLFTGLDDALTEFREWAKRRGVETPPCQDDLRRNDLVNLPQSEDDNTEAAAPAVRLAVNS